MAVRRDAAAAETVEIAIPDVEQAQAHGKIARQRGRDEVRIHRMRAGQQRTEMRGAHGDRDRQAYRRPQRIAPADPFPEAQRAADAELRCSCHIGRQRNEMLGNRAFAVLRSAIGQKPGTDGMCVEHGLGRGERLRGHEEQRAFGAHARQHMAQLMAVDIGDEMKPLVGAAPIFERIDHDFRSQMRAAYADIDDVGDLGARAHLLGQREHRVQRVMHRVQRRAHRSRHGTLAQQPAVARHAQQPVHRGTLFGSIDGRAGEHLVAALRQTALLCEVCQQLLGCGRDAVLGQISKYMRRLLAQRREALGVGGKGLDDIEFRHFLLVMACQRLPGRGLMAQHCHPRLPPVASGFRAAACRRQRRVCLRPASRSPSHRH